MSGSVLWTCLHFGRWGAELWKPLTFRGYIWTLVYFSICGWGRENIALSVIGDREGLPKRGLNPSALSTPVEQRARTNKCWESVRWKKSGISTGWKDGSSEE